jgi:hypothetical protein
MIVSRLVEYWSKNVLHAEIQIKREAAQHPPPLHELSSHVVPQQPFGREQLVKHCSGVWELEACWQPTTQLFRWKPPLVGFGRSAVGNAW